MCDTVRIIAPLTRSKILRNFIQSELVKFILKTSRSLLIVAVVSEEAVKQNATKDRIELARQ